MKLSVFIVSVLMAVSMDAHSLLSSSIEVLVEGAGCIVVGKVVKVEIIDRDGHEINDPKTMIWPGFTVQLHVVADWRNILKGDRKKRPNELIIPQRVVAPWAESRSIESIKKSWVGQKYIFLLNDKHLTPISDHESVKWMSEKESIVKVIKKGPPKREPPSRSFSSGSR